MPLTLAQLERHLFAAADVLRVKMDASEVEKRKLVKANLMEDLLTGRVRVTPLLENASV